MGSVRHALRDAKNVLMEQPVISANQNILRTVPFAINALTAVLIALFIVIVQLVMNIRIGIKIKLESAIA